MSESKPLRPIKGDGKGGTKSPRGKQVSRRHRRERLARKARRAQRGKQ